MLFIISHLWEFTILSLTIDLETHFYKLIIMDIKSSLSTLWAHWILVHSIRIWQNLGIVF